VLARLYGWRLTWLKRRSIIFSTGVTVVQCFIFYNSRRNDSAALKLLVALVLLMDTMHVVFVVHALYWYLVTNYGNLQSLESIPWSLTAVIMLSPTSDTLIRLFYTRRIWILSKRNKWHVYPLLTFIIVLEADALANAIETITSPNFEAVITKIEWVLYLGFSISVLEDFWIAGLLSYFLYKSRAGISRFDFSMPNYSHDSREPRTDNVINLLMVYTINTGLLTAIVQLSCFICNIALPKTNLVWLGLYLPLGKLYANALLASLNARDHIKSRLRETIPMSGRRAANTDGIATSIRFQADTTSDVTEVTNHGLGSKIEAYPTFRERMSVCEGGSESALDAGKANVGPIV
jgi:hypothetical protein